MRQDKNLLLNEIKDKMDGSKSLVLTRYKNLNPNLAAAFRMDIAKTGASFEVVKKRVLIKAAQNAGFALDRADMQGHIGVVFVEEDPIQTTKFIYKFCKENEDNVEVLGGRFEGRLCSAKDVELLSQLPSQDEMRSQLLGLFEAPMSQTLAAFEALLCSVIYCLDNKTQVNESNPNSEILT